MCPSHLFRSERTPSQAEYRLVGMATCHIDIKQIRQYITGRPHQAHISAYPTTCSQLGAGVGSATGPLAALKR